DGERIFISYTPVGQQGEPGGAVTLRYNFDDATTDSDPGNGWFKLNNATQASATTIYIDLIDGQGEDRTTLLDSLDDSTSTVKGHLRIRRRNNLNDWLLFQITGVTTATGYRKLSVTNIGSS